MFNETSLPKKEGFYSNLNMQDTKDSDYNLAERVCKDFELKNLNIMICILKTDTLLLADVFEDFRKMYLGIYDLDPAKRFSTPGLSWKAALKKTRSINRF